MLSRIQSDTLTISQILQFSFNLHTEVFHNHGYNSGQICERDRLILQRRFNNKQILSQLVKPNVCIWLGPSDFRTQLLVFCIYLLGNIMLKHLVLCFQHVLHHLKLSVYFDLKLSWILWLDLESLLKWLHSFFNICDSKFAHFGQQISLKILQEFALVFRCEHWLNCRYLLHDLLHRFLGGLSFYCDQFLWIFRQVSSLDFPFCWLLNHSWLPYHKRCVFGHLAGFAKLFKLFLRYSDLLHTWLASELLLRLYLAPTGVTRLVYNPNPVLSAVLDLSLRVVSVLLKARPGYFEIELIIHVSERWKLVVKWILPLKHCLLRNLELGVNQMTAFLLK